MNKRALIPVLLLLLACTQKRSDARAAECERVRQENARLTTALQEARRKVELQAHYIEGMERQANVVRPNGVTLEPATTGFSVFAFFESNAVDGEHQAIGLSGIPIVVLSNQGEFPTTSDRASAVLATLNRAVAASAAFYVSDRSIVARDPDGAEEEVIKIVDEDVAAFQARSAGAVSAERLAAYWAALLNDYLDLRSGRDPARLASSGIRIIRAVYDRMPRAPQSPAAPASPDSIMAAVEALPDDARQTLIQLATHVPVQFTPSG